MVNAVATSAGGYTAGGSAGNTGDQAMVEEDGSWKLEKCVQAYNTYLDNKTLEIQEQQNARRYRHGAQWTADQIKTFNDRKQPVVTYNKIGRKIDGIVGLVERLKQDPKAFPRTPQHQQGADLATAVLRYHDGRQPLERGGAADHRRRRRSMASPASSLISRRGRRSRCRATAARPAWATTAGHRCSPTMM